MPSTMRDVAARAGVSVTTVSHVLNQTPHRPIAADTRKRILEAVRELSYYADANARQLAQHRSSLFGLIVSEIANPFFPDVIKGFESAALARAFDLLLCNTQYDPARTKAAVRKMLENKVRGVAVATSMFDTALAEPLGEQHIPIAALGQGPARGGISILKIGFAGGMAQAVENFIG